jgi:hypothetical protein
MPDQTLTSTTEWAMSHVTFGSRCHAVAEAGSAEGVDFVLGRYLSASQADGDVGAFIVERSVVKTAPEWFTRALRCGNQISIQTLMAWASEGRLQILPAERGDGTGAPWDGCE